METTDVEFEVRWADIRQADEGSLWVTVTEERFRTEGWKPQDENDPCEHHHCGSDDCSCPILSPDVEAILESWHNDAHPGVFRFCDESPCAELWKADL